ncbi:16S rRNA (cytosine(967)-C(5))-methyltransferase RsmB [uncultured Pseudoflavonifractor sp.]|uniref:16S rRNA (cytosine(967)-C(5))-methyltransferase RsmB n=1 Tax=uncultured Pseudoflavonifractor sp. TaxID=1221379 RepID=UPI0025F4D925|nr:16S rRNA (cytosine(967)-C(5))-methyltransferase RsmB [uncultured Pseudoflavonifractor sp.]
MPSTEQTARETALLALSACERQGAWSDGFLKKTLREAGLDSRDAALATRLCFGVLQNRLLLDFYIGKFSTTRPEKMEIKVRNALRLGVYQMAFMTKIPHNAAVNESVELTKKHCKNPRAAGMVNGVLRNVSRNIDRLPVIESGSREEYLSIRYSHPLWLVREFTNLLGSEEAEALLEADNGQPPITAQINTCRATMEHTLERLAEAGVEAHPHPWLPDCLVLSGTGNLEYLTAFREGLFYIQDPAARLAVEAADPRPGMRVLDACAAPGGKTFAAAIRMGGAGEIQSCDIHAHKEKLIQAGAERLGFTCVKTAVMDGKKHRPAFENAFDVVIADVPCSGLGIIRKKPDIRYKDPEPLAGLPAVQSAILDNVATYVKPGGVLLYATCTLLERENGDVVRGFLDRNKDFTLEKFQLPEPLGRAENGMFTFWPQRHGTDGFFIAKLRRNT